MAKLLLLDFETCDSSISLGLGAGWVFGCNKINTVRFEIVGWSTSVLDTDTMEFTPPQYNVNGYEEKVGLLYYLHHSDGLIAHQITYELGCLKFLGIDVPKDKKLYDTKIIAQLYNNEVEHIAGRSPFSLENLSEIYLPKEQRKAIDILIDDAINRNLVEKPKRSGYNVERYRDKVEKWCYSNMDKLSPQAVGEYCNQDLVATGNLFIKFVEKENALV